MNPEKLNRLILITLAVLFCTGMIFFEKYKYNDHKLHVYEHANIIQDALWNLDYQSPVEYLKMAAWYYNYESINVFAVSKEKAFLTIKGPKQNNFNQILIKAGLIPRFHIDADILHQDRKIGLIKVVLLHSTIYVYCYVLLILVLILLVVKFFIQTIHAKNVLEDKVQERTTELKMSEEALRQNYIQLKAIYNTLPVILWSMDENGIFTLSEGKELSSLGLVPGQVVGMSGFDLYKDYPSIVESIKKGLKGHLCEFETVINEVDYHCVLTPFFNENNIVLGLNGLAVNVSEKRKVEEEIRKLRNYLSNIIDSMPSLIVGVDSNGLVTQWNKMAEKATGISARNARGKIISGILPQMAVEKDKIIQSIQSHQVIQEQKKPFETKNGMIYQDVTIYPLTANGEQGAVIRIDDVTDKVRLEEMMVQSEKMLSVGGLAAGMAHEINNPLAGMIQNANVMKSRLEDLKMPANLRAADDLGIPMESIKAFMEKRGILKMVVAINESGSRVAEIVDNMLSFARKTDAAVSSHNPSQLMDQILNLAATDYDLKKQFDFKTIKIIKEYEDNLPILPCEGAKIQQVMLNILRNGAQAMQAETKDESAAPCFILRLAVEKETNMLRIEIEDNGPGIDEETLKRIFEPFFTTKAPGLGTGLGLSVSYFIITKNHGGTMDAESIPGKGTTFIVRLPLQRCAKKNG